MTINEQIQELKTEAKNLINNAGFAVRHSKGFPEAVALIEKNISVMEQINNELEALKNGS